MAPSFLHKPFTTTRRCWLGLAAISLLPARAVAVQRGGTLRIIVPAAPGSAPDLVARLVGDELQSRLQKTVIVDNMPGAGGIIAAMAAKAARPDGDTLLLAHAAMATVTPLTYRAAKYDIGTDFEPVSVVAESPLLIVANLNGPKTLREAIDRARSAPGTLSFGSTSRGSIPHLSAELLGRATDARFSIVPMGNSGQAIQAVVNGDTALSIDGAPPLLPLVQSGRVRVLATTASRPLPRHEALPLAGATVPGFSPVGWFMLFAPSKTPVARIAAVNQAVADGLATASMQQRLAAMATYPAGGSVADAQAFLAKERRQWAAAVQQAGMRPE